PFHPPSWIEHFAADEDLLYRTHDDITAGYWWIEVGNPPFDTITDNEKIRDELYRQLLGVWDHIKNQDDHGADNLHIDFIGAVPGKRESRRIVGDYMMVEADIQRDAGFRDAVAYGGWFCDLHTMGGLLNKTELPEPSFNNDLSEVDKRQMYTYSIPLRSLYSRKIENLLMAGRNISVSHVALGSTRLMATCAVIGQAAGTSAVWCVKKRKNPREICEEYIGEIQTQLLKDDCYIPGQKNRDPDDIARTAEVSVSSHAKLVFPPGEIGFEFEHPKQKTYTRSNLDTERAQLFPCSTGKVSQINLQLHSESKSEQMVKVSIYKAKNIVGFDCKELLFTKEINVPAGYRGYFPVTCGVETDSQSLLYVTAVSNKEVFWLYSPKPPTGTVSAARIIKNWKPQKGSYGLQLIPESCPYRGENLLSGITRPDEWTNIWISDPEKEGMAWVTYKFSKQQMINVIHLTFDTNVNLAHMSVPGLYKAPECVKDYRILGLAHNNNWIELVSVSGNFQRKCIHRIKEVSVSSLKLEIQETNGDSSARLYELRAYHE
ncbi:MAG: FAD-dependent oxidoreductase, partial [Spirochaetia bacterium]|nr:FAD-dependent oxidoreductase [Spirochaetia bacterium]